MRHITAFLIILVVVSLVGCTQKEVSTQPTQLNYPLKGVSLSPKSFEGTDFTDFFVEANQVGEIVMWAGDWNELVNEKAPYTIAGLASTYDYISLIEVTIHSTGELIRPLDETTKQSYKNSAVAFAEKYKPQYLALGIEINAVYRESPEDFDEFVLLYNEVYSEIKQVSPETKVFTIFQLEKMKGLTFWGIETNEPEWHVIDRFDSDIAAFTTYPGLVYKDPSEIPADHYTEILSHTSKPIAFTEIGWHTEASPLGWESSEAEQAEFIEKFFVLTSDLNTEVLIWSFLYDPPTIEPFRSMGLRNSDGSAREGLDVWVEAK